MDAWDGAAGVDSASLTLAHERLGAGWASVAVFAELAARTGDWHRSAWAVCLALGIPAPDVAGRFARGMGDVATEFHQGEEELCGEVLETVGLFDVPRPLDERGTEIAGLPATAAGALGGMPSGHALTLSRRRVRGELTGMFLSPARTLPRRERARPAEYWAALSAAGDLLLQAGGEEGREVERALQECRRRAAEHPSNGEKPVASDAD
ncbi:hypothetical protein BKI49_29025 [Streptomyces sp. Tue6028]|uniref:hypothetical protein n=1 Tax=Streptomyces sp. Tue6028 TaxID=2036037 RepID=UPI000BB3206A|nr:hypothetical protein [Streptomyces sp. Tue6028]PBC60549.1 hypothetical protein BKI49_29025 [Streptomyces sp. Tue6028]